MHEFFVSSSYFCVLLTLVAFSLGNLCQKKWKLAVLNPILIGAGFVMAVLTVLDIPNETYQTGCQILNYLLTPATICLSISFYQQFRKLKQHIWAILAGVLAGITAGIGSIWLLCRMFRLDRALTLSLLPKSITNAIGVALSQEIGGIAAVTTAAIAVTGILGNMLGPVLCRLLKLKEPIAQGVAFGTASHVIGTSKADELSHLAGAAGSLSLTMAGLVTALALSILSQYA